MSYFNTCSKCGAALDPGETCSCTEKEKKERQQAEEERYSCFNCLNKHPKVCKHCHYITAPGGKKKKPSLFCEGKIPKDVSNLQTAKRLIEGRINSKKPIPLAFVLFYNECIQEK